MKNKILIYDDDQEILLLCKAILNKYDFEAGTLSRCDNIISDIKVEQPDLILMDLWIPEIGGEKAIDIVKQNPDTKNIPVLIFSANADLKEICSKVNADGYIEKPFTVDKFIKIIEQHTADISSKVD